MKTGAKELRKTQRELRITGQTESSAEVAGWAAHDSHGKTSRDDCIPTFRRNVICLRAGESGYECRRAKLKTQHEQAQGRSR